MVKKREIKKERIYRKKSEVKPVSKPASTPAPKPELKRTIVGYFATSNLKDVRLLNIGRVYRGKEFEVDKETYDALKCNKHFKVRIKYEDGD